MHLINTLLICITFANIVDTSQIAFLIYGLYNYKLPLAHPRLIWPNRKHSLRHEKSHKCDVPQCSRGDRGFGTINDLERHKKSKHGIKPKHGTAKSYRCASKKCEWAPKIWPRLDNFKQHVKRVHRNEDAERLIAM